MATVATMPVAWALPTQYQSVAGNVQFAQNGKTLNVSTQARRSIANYGTFNIAQDETVNFHLPDAQSAILNRVIGGSPSQILGAVNSNGQVFLLNASGILFGSAAQVNVGSLFASTLDVSNQDFLAGNWGFRQTSPQPGAVVNQGNITVQPGGFAVLAGGAVHNAGNITAPQGHIALAAGSQVTLNVDNGLAVNLTVDETLIQKLADYQEAVSNIGKLTAAGGLVQMQAMLQKGLYQYAVNNTGVVEVNTLNDLTGEIVVKAGGGDAWVRNTGKLLAMGGSGETGGKVVMQGDTVSLEHPSLIDVSGDIGGGTVLVGGDYLGQNPQVQNAQYTFMGSNAKIKANAGTSGDGGKVILWADEATAFYGRIEAKGGLEHGNGGFVETSGKNLLQALGQVNASAPNGQAGQWLLDPNNILISTAPGDTNINVVGGVFDTTDDSAVVSEGSILAALNGGTSVTVQTGTAGVDSEDGTITVEDGVNIVTNSVTDVSLTLKAHNHIVFDGTVGTGITIGSSNGKLDISLNSDSDEANGGAVSLAYTTLDSNGGNIVIGGGANPLNTAAIGNASLMKGVYIEESTLQADGGNITITGQAHDDAGTGSLVGVQLSGSSLQTTGTGNINITGTGGDGISFNYGLAIRDASTVQTASGDINLDGTSGAGTGTGNEGIRIMDLNTLVTTQNGTITMTGQGGGTGAASGSNKGIQITTDAKVTATGTGSIDLTGTGGNAGNSNAGISINSGAEVTTSSGTLELDGTGGAGGQSNYGIEMNGGVLRTHSGQIIMTGQGAGNDSWNYGIYLLGGSTIVQSTGGVGTGNISLTGTGGDGTLENYGIRLHSGADVLAVGGNITLNGTGGDGTQSDNIGVVLTNNGTSVVTQNGIITLIAQGGGGVGSSQGHGLYMSNNASIEASVGGEVDITATGGGEGANIGAQLQNGALISTVTGNLSLQGTANGTGDTNYGIYIVDAEIETTDGAVTLTGTGSPNATGTENYGIFLNTTSAITASGTGSISLTGEGGTGTTDNIAIWIKGDSTITTLSGNITLDGTGGDGTGTNNHGILVEDANTAITTQDGTISLIGQGGGTGGATSTNYGIYIITDAGVSATGTGNISLDGTGGAGTGNNRGVYLTGNSLVSTADGNLQVQGTGGAGGNNNLGIFIQGAGLETANGQITLTGFGSLTATGSGNQGIYATAGSIEATGAGGISLTGEGGSGVSSNYGIWFEAATTVTTQSGNITLDGTGGAGTGSTNHGIFLRDLNTAITSQGGDVTLIAEGGGTGGATLSNRGLVVSSGVEISTIGNGNISITGLGGNGLSDNVGIVLVDGQVSTVDGTLELDGTSGEGTDNKGIWLSTNQQIVTQNGQIVLTGQNGTTTGTENYGIWLTSGVDVEATGTGGISLTGNGGAGTDENYGIWIEDGSTLTTQGGNITLDGTGGAGTGSANHGILVEDANTEITTQDGTITLTGEGGGTGAATHTNRGIVMQNSVLLEATGTGSISLTGDGGNGGSNNTGIYLVGDASIATLSGNLSLDGTGTGTDSSNEGIFMAAAGTDLITQDGTISLTGQGSLAGTGNSNTGIFLVNDVVIRATGTGSINLTGDGGNGSSSNAGIFIVDAVEVSTVSANVTLDGTGGGNNSGIGIFLSDLGTVITSQDGTISLTGQGSTTATGTSNAGIHLASEGLVHATGNGAISLQGNGGTGTQFNMGIFITDNGTAVTADGTGQITLTANGGAGTDNHAINMLATTQISSADGNLTLQALGANGNIVASVLDSGNGLLLIHSDQGSITLNMQLTSNAAGDAITVAASNGDFHNDHGASLFNLTGGGRWLAYSTLPENDTLGGLTGFSTRFGTSFGDNIAGLTGNYFFYSGTAPSSNNNSPSDPMSVVLPILFNINPDENVLHPTRLPLLEKQFKNEVPKILEGDHIVNPEVLELIYESIWDDTERWWLPQFEQP